MIFLLPLLLLGQIVVDRVVVRFVSDKYVLLHREVGRSIERSRRNTDLVTPNLPPKQIAAAAATESTLGGVRGLVPEQTLGSRQFKICRRRARHGHVVSARSAALRTMAGNDPAQLAA